MGCKVVEVQGRGGGDPWVGWWWSMGRVVVVHGWGEGIFMHITP